jgi:hypothetical protein
MSKQQEQQEQQEQEDLDRAILSSIMEMSLKDSSVKSASSSNFTRVYSSVDVKRPEVKLNNLNGCPSNQVEEQRQNFLLQIASLLDEIEKIKESASNTSKYIENRVKEKQTKIGVLQARLTAINRQQSNSNTNIRNNDSERIKILDRISSLDTRLLVESNERVKQEIFDEIEVLRLVLDSL